MGKDREFGTDYEIGAFVNVYNVPVTVFREDNAKNITQSMTLNTDECQNEKPLKILIIGSERSGHWVIITTKTPEVTSNDDNLEKGMHEVEKHVSSLPTTTLKITSNNNDNECLQMTGPYELFAATLLPEDEIFSGPTLDTEESNFNKDDGKKQGEENATANNYVSVEENNVFSLAHTYLPVENVSMDEVEKHVFSHENDKECLQMIGPSELVAARSFLDDGMLYEPTLDAEESNFCKDDGQKQEEENSTVINYVSAAENKVISLSQTYLSTENDQECQTIIKESIINSVKNNFEGDVANVHFPETIEEGGTPKASTGKQIDIFDEQTSGENVSFAPRQKSFVLKQSKKTKSDVNLLKNKKLVNAPELEDNTHKENDIIDYDSFPNQKKKSHTMV